MIVAEPRGEQQECLDNVRGGRELSRKRSFISHVRNGCALRIAKLGPGAESLLSLERFWDDLVIKC